MCFYTCFTYFWKTLETEEEQREEPLVQFRNQRGSSFKTFKYDAYEKPNALILTKNVYK